MKYSKTKFKFVDLFAGIGGFHQAMKSLGGICVMASEIDNRCIATYKANFKDTEVRGDINGIDPTSIKNFHVLCAGFPCQPFSKAGARKGFEDETRGNLFYTIMNVLDMHDEVKFVILENVRNLADNTQNWDIIKTELMKRNFYITEEPIILSPSDFGIPQIRERVYILGIRKDIRDEKILTNGYIHKNDLNIEKEYRECKMGDAFSILEKDVDDAYIVDSQIELMIEAWDEFRIATGIKRIGYPVWLDYFGLNIDNTEDFYIEKKYHGMKPWKQNYVLHNRKLYLENREFIDSWVKKYNMTNRIKLFRKFEWNCGEDVSNIKNTIIQVRQSGIRVKRPTFFPSLVAMVNTPIVWDNNKQHYRFISLREAANLQSFDKNYKFTGTNHTVYKQLGNSVNVKIVKMLTTSLFRLAKKGWESEE